MINISWYKDWYLNLILSTLVIFSITLVEVGADIVSLKVEKTQTRVSLARVSLELNEVKYESGYLTGNYQIRVPLARRYNDIGVISLGVEDIENMRVNGGTITGVGISKKDGVEYAVICKVEPSNVNGGKLDLKITMDGRVLRFNTTYEL
jgi:hypothetical protein